MNDHHENDRPPVSLADRVRSLQLPQSNRGSASPGAKWLPWLLCLAFAGFAGYLGYQQYLKEDEQAGKAASPSAGDAAAAGAGERKTYGADAKPGTAILEAGGYVVPFMKSQVSPKVGGQIVELFIEEGQFVKKGQLLARLDKTEYEFEYRRMAALAEQAQARYEELKNGSRQEEKNHSQAQLKEAETLHRQLVDEAQRLRQSGFASTPDELVKIESRLTQAQYRVEQLRQMDKMMQDGPRREKIAAAKGEYDHAVAQRDKAKYALDNTDVVSQITGVILEKKAELGDTVRPESFGQGLSANLCVMADLTNLEVDVDVSERDLGRIFKGQKCKIRTEAFPDQIYDGYIARIMPLANRSKASVSVRVKILMKENDPYIRPEMRARVQFLAGDKAEARPQKEKSQ